MEKVSKFSHADFKEAGRVIRREIRGTRKPESEKRESQTSTRRRARNLPDHPRLPPQKTIHLSPRWDRDVTLYRGPTFFAFPSVRVKFAADEVRGCLKDENSVGPIDATNAGTLLPLTRPPTPSRSAYLDN